MKKILIILLTLVSSPLLANADIEKVLNDFHQAAATANYQQYFNLLTEDAIFLGTAPKERWSKKAFMQFAKPYFSAGKGWVYKPLVRNISVVKENSLAFFDEELTNSTYGDCRGSGVMIKTADGWKIAQYNLSIPLPNEITKKIVKQIEQFKHSNSGS